MDNALTKMEKGKKKNHHVMVGFMEPLSHVYNHKQIQFLQFDLT